MQPINNQWIIPPTSTQTTNNNIKYIVKMVTKSLGKETLEIAASIKLRIEKYYEQLDKQVSERTNR